MADIIVNGELQRLPGSVDAPQAPIAVLSQEDVAAYGAQSISELLAALAPQTGSGRGRGGGGPVILLNGQRIASFRELRDFPPEAIRRVEILPEEVALRYGYAPDSRVVNFILKDHFRARVLDGQGQVSGHGGADSESGEASLLTINRQKRLNLVLKADRTSPLTYADRGISATPTNAAPTVAGDPDPAQFRTLVSRARDESANATYSMPVGGGRVKGTLSLNGTVSRSDSTGLSGLNSVGLTAPGGVSAVRSFAGPLAQTSRTDVLSAGASLNKPIGLWQLSATVDSTHTLTEVRTDNRADTTALAAAASAGMLAVNGPLPALAPAGSSLAHTDGNSVTSLVTLIGHPLRLPAGKVALTAKAGIAYTGQTASSSQTNAGAATTLTRGDASVGFNLGIPLTSRRDSVLAAIGDITANLSAGLNRLSDFGTLTNATAGLTWGVTPRLNLQASYIVNQAAPSLANLGGPQVVTQGVPIFDFVTGQSVLASVTTGGNPALVRQGQHDIKLGVNWTLPGHDNANLLVEYFANRSNNVTIGFPLLTLAVASAYAGRITRNGAGTIVAVDERPVTLASQIETRLRGGFNFSGNLGKPLPPQRGRFGGRFGGGGPPGGGPPGGGMGGPPPGGGFGGGGGGDRGGGGGGRGGGRGGPRYPGRWNLSIFDTVQFIDRARLTPGGPLLDLLGGDALSGGGIARHMVEVDAGAFYKGLGLRLGGTWNGPTHIDGAVPAIGAAPGSTGLRFGAVAKFNLRLFVELGQQARLVKAASFFTGARLQLRIANILDSRQRVTDAAGNVPAAYQPDLVDPLGRVFGLEFRKLF